MYSSMKGSGAYAGKFRVRERRPWKKYAADLEAEMLGRGTIRRGCPPLSDSRLAQDRLPGWISPRCNPDNWRVPLSRVLTLACGFGRWIREDLDLLGEFLQTHPMPVVDLSSRWSISRSTRSKQVDQARSPFGPTTSRQHWVKLPQAHDV
jgi:hypothetical protein